VWGQDSWRVARGTTLTGGLRLEHVGDAGVQASPRLVLLRALPHDLRLRVQWSRAYRAPSFRERAFDLPTVHGNPDLDPTTVQTAEAALVLKRDPLELSANLYRSWLHHPVRLTGTPSIETPAGLVNGPSLDVNGLELTGRRFFGRSVAFLYYSFQDANDATGASAVGVSKHTAAVGGTVAVDDRLSLSPQWTVRSPRPRATGDTRPELGGYGALRLSARRVFLDSRRLEVRLVLTNALDQGYRDPAPAWGVPGDYPRPGRAVYIDAKYRF
jgi:iron complex outermembrane receptor protein